MMNFRLEHEGIDLGFCGALDLDFMHRAGIEWDELTNMILRCLAESRRFGGFINERAARRGEPGQPGETDFRNGTE